MTVQLETVSVRKSTETRLERKYTLGQSLAAKIKISQPLLLPGPEVGIILRLA